MITTEFDRTTDAQADRGKLSRGRDHYPHGFTNGRRSRPVLAFDR
jgi:hypothetical protein